MIRAIATFLVAVGLLASAATAGAEPVARLADLDSSATSPFGFDQVSKRCAASIAARDTSRSYSGSASLKVHTENDPSCGGPYARGIFQANSTRHLVAGDDFWFGAAIYLPAGFYNAHTAYTDLLRVDSYVRDDSSNTPYGERAEINFASWGNDDLYVRAARGDTSTRLIGPISPAKLPEGSWNWVELHVKLSPVGGAAYTELKVNGKTVGSSTNANLFAGAAPLNRLRYGLVSTESSGSGNLTALFDRASISLTERGPIENSAPEPEQQPQTPTPEPQAPSTPAGLWRLNESSGTRVADTMGLSPGTYVNGPTLGVRGIAGSGGTAVSFDGVDDYIAIAPTAPLNVTEGVTIEGWIEADVFHGSLAQRTGCYELRPVGHGNIIFRVWVDGAIKALATGPETISANAIHHLVGAYDGESLMIYLDGSLVISKPQSGPISNCSNPLYIGLNTTTGTSFSGTIDDVAIYPGALSAAVIANHATYGNGLG